MSEKLYQDSTNQDADRRHPGKLRSASHSIRLILGTLLFAATIAVAIDNSNEVRVGWVAGNARAPLAVVLAVTALVGAVLGWLLVHRPARHQHLDR